MGNADNYYEIQAKTYNMLWIIWENMGSLSPIESKQFAPHTFNTNTINKAINKARQILLKLEKYEKHLNIAVYNLPLL